MIPTLDFTGQEFEVTMMELRSQPGEIFDRVSRGALVHVTKGGKRIATIRSPLQRPNVETIVHRDGSFEGPKPLTFGLDLGGEYGMDFHDLAKVDPAAYNQFI